MVLKICRVLVLVALSLSVFAALFGCAGCVIERDPIDLCPNLDEMIGDCHDERQGWGCFDEAVDDEQPHPDEWTSVELGCGDSIVLQGQRLKDGAAFKRRLLSRYEHWVESCKTGSVNDPLWCISVKVDKPSVGLVASVLDACLEVHRQKVLVFDLFGDDRKVPVTDETRFEPPDILHGFEIDLDERCGNWIFVRIDRGGNVMVNGDTVGSKDELRSLFRAFRRSRRGKDPQVFVEADASLQFSQVFKVLNAATAGGVWRIYLAGRKSEETGLSRIGRIRVRTY